MRRLLCIGLIFIAYSLVQAHEFWLLPQKFRFNSGEKLLLDFMVGENFEGTYWDLNRHAVEKLSVHNRLSSADLTAQVSKTSGKNLEYTFNNIGTHLFAMESNNAFLELEPAEFEAYLKEDGLEYVIEERKSRGEAQTKSRELYRRFAKLLVQVGDRTDDTYKKPTSQQLEIIPTKNPYDLRPGDYLQCKLYYRDHPEPHALVKVWSHLGNRIFLQNIYTESDGSITFPVSSRGPWMVSTVKMIRSDQPEAEWQSLWSSLVFEIN